MARPVAGSGGLGGDGIVRRRMAEKIGDDAAVDVALDGDRENVAEHGRKARVKLGMSQHGGPDNDFSAGIEFAIGALL